jgi:prolyl-tRNA editing enzyme YbaK/EbsC (Cys-tRNA(Pro) deacylase)
MIVNDELTAGVRRMLADADQRGLAVELRRRPVAHSLEEAAELLGIAPSDIAKTIVVRRSNGITCSLSSLVARRLPGPS